jgi:hypothetical protein
VTTQEKPWLKKLTRMTDTQMWEAFDDMLNHFISLQHKNMEQSDEPIDIYRAQGFIQALKRLKFLKEEIQHAQQKS